MLSPREIKILNSIVNSFIETGQPVGSRTLERNYNIGLSSATIRNVMSDLEDKGLISKTHHSSGRVPSGFAIERYVLDLIDSKEKQEDNPRKFVSRLLEAEGNRLETMMLKAGEVLNLMTNYATLTFIPHSKNSTIKQVFVKRIDEKNLLLVLMTTDMDVSTNIIFDNGLIEVEKFNNFLKEYFYNKDVNYFIDNLEKLYNDFFYKDLGIISSMLKYLNSDKVYDEELNLSGIYRILEHPDFYDSDNVKQIAMIMEDNSEIKDVVKDWNGNKISVHIGDGNTNLKNLSIITSNYKVRDGRIASFGIVAPIRMNYDNAINAIIELDKTLRYLIDGYWDDEGD